MLAKVVLLIVRENFDIHSKFSYTSKLLDNVAAEACTRYSDCNMLNKFMGMDQIVHFAIGFGQ